VSASRDLIALREERDPFMLAELVDLDDTGMLEAGNGVRLGPKSHAPIS